jgi:hypothetical protein
MGSNRSFIKPVVDFEFNSPMGSKGSFKAGSETCVEKNSEREENCETNERIQKRLFSDKFKEVVHDEELKILDCRANDDREKKILRRQETTSHNLFNEDPTEGHPQGMKNFLTAGNLNVNFSRRQVWV